MSQDMADRVKVMEVPLEVARGSGDWLLTGKIEASALRVKRSRSLAAGEGSYR